MDKEELQKNIALYYSKLPLELQEIFSSMKWLETLKQISLKHDLNKKQQETLGTETTLVLLGIIHLDEYQKNLSMELNLPKESMDNIFFEINNSILNIIQLKLIKTFELNVKTGRGENANWQQNLNFILSGGDYSAFVNIPPPLSGEDRGEVPNAPHPNPLLKGEGATPRRITDIKNRFTI